MLPSFDENEPIGSGCGERIDISRILASAFSVGEMGDRFLRKRMVLCKRCCSLSFGTRSLSMGCRAAACRTNKLPNCLFMCE